MIERISSINLRMTYDLHMVFRLKGKIKATLHLSKHMDKSPKKAVVSYSSIVAYVDKRPKRYC